MVSLGDAKSCSSGKVFSFVFRKNVGDATQFLVTIVSKFRGHHMFSFVYSKNIMLFDCWKNIFFSCFCAFFFDSFEEDAESLKFKQ